MNHRFVIFSIGKLLQMIAVVMIIPLIIAVADLYNICCWRELLAHFSVKGFIIAILFSALTGSLLTKSPQGTLKGNAVREGFAIVTFGWVICTFVGAIPLFSYFLHESEIITKTVFFTAFTDSFFESMSGFTTTGATIIRDIEVLPRGILFWRSMTHWLGGMGIVTLVLAVFPAFGVKAYQMFRGEVPGPTAEMLRPRLAQTAKVLWGVYALLTILETFLLKLGGMSFFDAFCHAFGTMATGGFSTKNASVAAYSSPFIDWVIIIFMFLAGMNFMIHYYIMFAGKLNVLKKDHEFHFYLMVVTASILISILFLSFDGLGTERGIASSYRHASMNQEQINDKIILESSKIDTLEERVRHSAFQVISLTTTTGFCTADFDVWPDALRFLFILLMFFGGCAGSTGGGIKMVRILVVLKSVWREIQTTIQPRLVFPMKIADEIIEEKQVKNILGFVMLFLVLFVGFSVVMCMIIPDVTTAVTAVVATICNIGPGLSGVGATENYAWIPPIGKWILAFCMLIGRLEVFTVVIALSPISWRR